MTLAPRLGAEVAQAGLEALASDDPVALAAAAEALRRGTEAAASASGMDVDGGGGEASGHEDLTAVLSAAAGALGGADVDPARPVTAEQTRAAAAVALAAGAVRAKLMADEQAAEMERLTRQVLRTQLQRVRIKMKYLGRMGEVLAEEVDKQAAALEEKVAAGGGGGKAAAAETAGRRRK